MHLVLDKGTHLSRGYGYVTYLLPESATQARQALDNKFFQGTPQPCKTMSPIITMDN